jgi:hypothetical protein
MDAALRSNPDTDSIEHGGSDLSAFFVPNFPVKEPVFYIPKIPDIVKVPEPGPPRKPPPAGYDMKTLRRQLDFFNDQLEERTEVQALLYQQNEQLWVYIQDLLESNKLNAGLMKNYVGQLHQELAAVHKERYLAAEQLELAKNSKDMFSTLHKDLIRLQQELGDAEISKAEVNEALSSITSENVNLEAALREQVRKLHNIHYQIDEYRYQQQEVTDLEVADEYFYSSKRILYSAYMRFRSAIKMRFRLSKIAAVCKKTYRTLLYRSVYTKWVAYLLRRRCMKRCIERRNKERLELSLMRWKLFYAIEKACHRAQRRLLLGRVFIAWASSHRERKFEHWANEVTEDLKAMQLQRRIFLGWKSSVMYVFFTRLSTATS